ncbi:MAG: hypothetical protein ACPG5B_08025 [Chitinophagales bacterium]
MLCISIGLLLAGLHAFKLLGDTPNFVWIVYVFLSVLLFLVVGIAATSKNVESPSQSLTIVLGAMIIKFTMSLLLIIVYVVFARPENAFFIIPFFLLYPIYTAFEVHFLIQISKKETKKIDK